MDKNNERIGILAEQIKSLAAVLAQRTDDVEAESVLNVIEEKAAEIEKAAEKVG
jgi:hypothetical protein